MSKKKEEMSPVHKDTLKMIQNDPESAEAYFEELRASSIPVQLAILRRLSGIPQSKIASKLHINQAFVSKIEKPNSDHLISLISRVARALNGQLVVLPKAARVVFK